MKYGELTRRIRRLGFQPYKQAKGSHEIWWLPGTDQRSAIPNHGRRDIPKGTLHAILKELGLTQRDLEGS